MDRLSAPEGRVVASLVEKALTTPQQYPLTLNALIAACNQASNRDPVTSYLDEEVLAVLESLRQKRLVRAVLPSHGRTAVRYRHVLDETLGLDAAQLAVLAVLELRGPQTAAELRARTERTADIASIDHELELLAQREEPLVERIGRRPGQKEDRWHSLLAEGHGPPAVASEPAGGGRAADAGLAADVERVQVELADLRSDVTRLRVELEDLRASLGG